MATPASTSGPPPTCVLVARVENAQHAGPCGASSLRDSAHPPVQQSTQQITLSNSRRVATSRRERATAICRITA